MLMELKSAPLWKRTPTTFFVLVDLDLGHFSEAFSEGEDIAVIDGRAADHEAEEGGFPGARAAQDDEGFAFEDIKADGVEDRAAFVFFGGVHHLDDGFGVVDGNVLVGGCGIYHGLWGVSIGHNMDTLRLLRKSQTCLGWVRTFVYQPRM